MYFQKISISIPGLTEFFSFLHLGNAKFLVTTPSTNNVPNFSALWMVENGFRHRKLFADISNAPHAVAFGCQVSGSLVVAALKEQSVVVKDIKSGLDKK